MSRMSGDMLDLQMILRNSTDTRDWASVSSNLAEITKKLTFDEYRGKVTSEMLDEIAYTLKAAASLLRDKPASDVLTAVTECFRFLRNACAIQRSVQNDINGTPLFSVTSDLLNILCHISKEDGDVLLCIKIVVQFIGNAVVGNQSNQSVVWIMIHSHLRQLLSNSDHSLVNSTCMVFYNILLGESEAALKYAIANVTLLLQCCSEGSDFAVFALERVLGKEGVLKDIYPNLESKHQLEVLDMIWSLLVDEKQSELDVKISLLDMLFLVEQLKLRADSVLCIVDTGMTAEPRELLRLLDVVACASARTQYLSAFQADRSLLISIAYILKNVTEIGKIEGGNVFSCVQRLSEMKSTSVSVEKNPVFGFKASLVRLLGNLCYQHIDNQNQVRELNCIPSVLDACNIDVYNPLLLQWGVLAVRNLLENNAANQQVIAGLVAHGTASSTVLQELGMELHQDESGSLCIAPLKRS